MDGMTNIGCLHIGTVRCIAACTLLLFTHLGMAQLAHFVTARGDKLMDGETEFRFISFNIPNLHYIEDNQQFTEPSPWRAANEFEIRDALTAIKHMGGNVTRLYTPSVRKTIDDPRIIRHVNGPGVFDEEAFRAYDKVLQIADEAGVRVIIPFIDNWWWWGGIADYARFRGKPKEAFWSDSTIIADFKKTIEFMVGRVNAYTGIPYKEDKAILGWETGNELEVPTFAWTRQITAYIKSLDKNHLVIEGTHSQVILDEAVADPNIDVLSTHFYRPAHQLIKSMLEARAKAQGKKPYFIGEFGYMPTDSMRLVLDSVISSGISGILGWNMRQHDRDGGFYYHGAAYRWPGFESGKMWDEQNVIRLFREKAYQINDLPRPPIPLPEPPKLLPVETPYKITWQGSAGARSYVIERKPKGRIFWWWQWDVIDSSASDANIGYRPLFADTTAEPGRSYSYRIRARNESGISEPSEPYGPVLVTNRLLIDELENDAHLYFKSYGIRFPRTFDVSRAKEDRSRLEGKAGEFIIYELPAGITSIQADAFLITAMRDSNLTFSSGISQDKLSPLAAERQLFEPCNNVYRYYCPIRYIVRDIPPHHRYLKIGLANSVQLGRIEIGYDAVK